MNRTMAAIAAAALATAAGAQAQTAGPQADRMGQARMDEGRGPPRGGPRMGGMRPDPARMFADMDSNRDGVVSKPEFMAFYTRMGAHGPHGGPGMRGPDGAGGRPPMRAEDSRPR